jgi:hypothetical protein
VLWELSVVEQRYTAIQEVLGGMPVTEVADRYGVSRHSVHAWLRRYRAGGLAGLEDRSHRPRSCPHQASVQIEAAVCKLRRQHPSWGPLTPWNQSSRRPGRLLPPPDPPSAVCGGPCGWALLPWRRAGGSASKSLNLWVRPAGESQRRGC